MRDLARFWRQNLLRNKFVQIGTGLALFIFFEAWLFPAFQEAPVSVNGRTVIISEPATAADAVREAGFAVTGGDLRDIDGDILEPGRGWAPQVVIDGEPGGLGAPIKRDARIEFVPGFDRVERMKAEVEELVVATVNRGRGPYTRIERKGAPGRKLVVRGRTSGKIISAKNLVRPRPMVISHTRERPHKVVALTFDDGPHPPYTKQIVKILRALDVKATFFVIGEQAIKFPSSVLAVRNAKQQIANHSFSHNRMDSADEESVTRDLRAAGDYIFAAANFKPTWFRPPYGAGSAELSAIADQMGYRVVKWNIDSRDWTGIGPKRIANKVVRSVYPGAIILMHDGGGDRTNTVRALPQIIRRLYERGYTFVTLDQLVK